MLLPALAECENIFTIGIPSSRSGANMENKNNQFRSFEYRAED